MMLELQNLTVRFGNLVAVNKLNTSVSEGTIHSLIGPNGAGKTTVFNAIYNLVPYTGDILFSGKSLRGVPTYRLSEMRMTRTFQNLSLFYSMTVEYNIALGLHTAIKSSILSDIAGVNVYSRKEVKQRVARVAELVGLSQLLNAYPAFLPYGTQKLVELARALVNDSKLVLLDEPAAGLNAGEKEQFKEILLKVKQGGVTILLVEHDMGVVMDISDKITVMNFGNRIAEGTPQEISENPDVIEAYLGVN
ncbi:MAG: ABC transporter ATP-binding protein [Candidatus Cryosericum sp.]|nr:ABC transporter ATP-binding protein [bacterium]